MNTPTRIAFIGGGNMARAMIKGLAGRAVPAANIRVVEIDTHAHATLQAMGVQVQTTPDAQLRQDTVWVLAVKPQQLKAVAESLRPYLHDSLVISIAAGIAEHDLARWLAPAGQAPWQRLVRCMPNTPALVGAGITGLHAGEQVNQADRDLADSLLKAVGQTVWVNDEGLLDAVTALSGSGPAYVFRFIEALIAGGEALGLSTSQSRELALATVAGAAKLATESTEPVGVLRERVTSKGGTTAAALNTFDQQGLLPLVAAAMKAAHDRAQAMSREFGQG